MNAIDKCIRSARRRLLLICWVDRLARCIAVAAFLFAIIVLVTRLYDLAAPVFSIGMATLGAALVASLLWAKWSGPTESMAAAALDDAAGLRERLSSGHYCGQSSDPFAQAVVADAERVSTALSVRTHFPLSWPSSLPFTAGSVALSALMFLVTPGLLTSTEADAAKEDELTRFQTQAAVRRQIDAVRKKIAETNPALAEVKEELESLDKWAGGARQKPVDLRHNAIKKLDQLADSVKKQQLDPKYSKTTSMRKMLRGLKVPPSSESNTPTLTKALARGDFATAREEVKKLQDMLATLKMEQDKEMVAKLSKQLTDLSKQLESLAKNDRLAQKLKQAGLKPEDVQRLLKNLKKKDLDQALQKLQESGMSQKEIKKLAKQLKQQQQAGSAAKNLAQAAGKAGSASAAGQMGDAIAGLQAADAQLSELEQLDQELSQLNAAASSLQDGKNGLNGSCSKCGNSGQPCGSCGGTGQGGMGPRMGQGRGGLSTQEKTDVAFKTEKAKVQTGQGAIIGQFLFDGPQVKGEIEESFAELVEAGERDATDLISRDRIPRQYQSAVKAYFSQVKEHAAGETNPSTSASDEQ